MNSTNVNRVLSLDPLPPKSKSFCLRIEDVFRLWGYKKNEGLAWGFLYLSGLDYSNNQIATSLEIQTVNVEVALQQLLDKSFISKKQSPEGQEPVYFCEPNHLKIVRKKVLMDQIQYVQETLEQSHQIKEQPEAEGSFSKVRLDSFQSFSVQIKKALKMALIVDQISL